MPDAPEFLTPRLLLRHWHPADLAPFAAMNADPEVMEHFPARLTRAESDAMAGRAEARLGSAGYGLWALEERSTGRFLGFTGLQPVMFEAPFVAGLTVEIGWRLRREAWGRGYAQEAARTVRDFAFEGAGLREIVSFTSMTNLRSMRVMEGIGMTRDPADDFDNPRLPPGHRLRPHVLYRLKRDGGRAIGAPATQS